MEERNGNSPMLGEGSAAQKRTKREDGKRVVEITLHGILDEIPTVESRLLVFKALQEREQLRVLYPTFSTYGLPEKGLYPEGWEHCVERGYRIVTGNIKKRLVKLKADLEKENEDYSDDSGSVEGFSDVYDGWVVPNTEEAENNQLNFLTMVRACLPILAYGFHVEPEDPSEDRDYCFCPCDGDKSYGTVAGRCRKLCGMSNVLGDKKCNNKGVIKKGPEAFIDHIKEKKKWCRYHEILYEFMAELYGYSHPYGYLFWKNGKPDGWKGVPDE